MARASRVDVPAPVPPRAARTRRRRSRLTRSGREAPLLAPRSRRPGTPRRAREPNCRRDLPLAGHGEAGCVGAKRMPLAWDLRNSFHVGPSRRGAGPSPFARSRVRILVAENPDAERSELTPDPDAAHVRFYRPILRMSSRISSGIGGLPPADRRRKVHFRRTSSWCRAKERLRAHEERRPPSSRKHPAHRGHEQPVATAKAWPARLALEDPSAGDEGARSRFRCSALLWRSRQSTRPHGAARDTQERGALPDLPTRPDGTNALIEPRISGLRAFSLSSRSVRWQATEHWRRQAMWPSAEARCVAPDRCRGGPARSGPAPQELRER
jgi:hypothetical protein